MEILTNFKKRMKSKRVQVPVLSALMMCFMCFPAFAEGTGTNTVEGLLTNFTTIAAWMWDEVGLLLSFIMEQPILFLTLSLFFIGAVVAFCTRVYKAL